MMTAAARLDRVLRAAGYAITGVSIGDQHDRTTWLVQPGALQGACQPHIDAFDPNDPAHGEAEKDALANQYEDETLAIAIGRVAWEELQKCTPLGGQTLLDFDAFKARVKHVYRRLL